MTRPDSSFEELNGYNHAKLYRELALACFVKAQTLKQAVNPA